MTLKQIYFTENECFRVGRRIDVKGILVHSTGANNPSLRRYVAPCDGTIGQNQHNNHWNNFHPEGRIMGPHRFENNGHGRCRSCNGRQVCVHFWIGRLADGSIATVQSLPADMRGWHSGGSANNTHTSFEICEDGLEDREYFNSVYNEAVELCAYLCNLYNLDPLGDGVLIDHAEGRRRGVASNHADVGHWFPRHGKSMDIFRNDVAALLASGGAPAIASQPLAQTPEATPSFPISEENLQAMVDMGIINSPNFWREVTSIQWLNELVARVVRRNTCDNHNSRLAENGEEALEIMVEAGIINTPSYWQEVLKRGIPHFDRLLMNMANSVCRVSQ